MVASGRITNADYSNMTTNETAFSISPEDQDLPTTEYLCDWSKWNGYYQQVPLLASVIDAKARWAVGKGFKSNKKALLDKITGNGKDTFNDILSNAVKTYTIGGDFFAEIIKNKRGELVNLKPINPGSMKILANDRGIIIGYEQQLKTIGLQQTIPFKPDQILHLSWNRLGDECHGLSTIKKLENIILALQEALTDYKIVMHRNISPTTIIELDEDDPTEVASFKNKIEQVYKNKEIVFLPKDTAKLTKVGVPQYSSIDPIPYLSFLQTHFIIAENVPFVILGSSEKSTEASAKIVYLAFQQWIEYNQMFLEDQIKSQLGIEIELEFPADLMEAASAGVNQGAIGIGKPDSFSKDGNKTIAQPKDVKI